MPTDADVMDPGELNEMMNSTVQPNAPKEQGGAKPAAPATEVMNVMIGGVEYTLPAAAAQALLSVGASYEAQLAALKAQAAPPPKAASGGEEEEYDWGTELLVNPKTAIAKLKEEIRAEVRGEMQADEAKTAAQRAFWDAFYEQHKELKDFHPVVKTLLDSNYDSLKNMTGQQAIDSLGKQAKELLLKAAKLQGPKGQQVQVEGGGAAAQKSSGEENTSKVASMSEIIAARRAKRAG